MDKNEIPFDKSWPNHKCHKMFCYISTRQNKVQIKETILRSRKNDEGKNLIDITVIFLSQRF